MKKLSKIANKQIQARTDLYDSLQNITDCANCAKDTYLQDEDSYEMMIAIIEGVEQACSKAKNLAEQYLETIKLRKGKTPELEEEMLFDIAFIKKHGLDNWDDKYLNTAELKLKYYRRNIDMIDSYLEDTKELKDIFWQLVSISLTKEQLQNLFIDEKWELIKHGQCLEIYIEDEDWRIHHEVATRGYGLDKLIKDEDSMVREQVASKGYGLDILVNDEEALVRLEVATQGYGLDKLVADDDSFVRGCVKNYLQDHNLTLEEWIIQYPEKCVL